MSPRPHIVAFHRLKEPRAASARDVQIDVRGEVGRPPLNVSAVDRNGEDAVSLVRRGRVMISSIVVVEAIVFLAIVSASVRGPADLPQSAWVLASLSLLFLVLSRLRLWATTRLQEG